VARLLSPAHVVAWDRCGPVVASLARIDSIICLKGLRSVVLCRTIGSGRASRLFQAYATARRDPHFHELIASSTRLWLSRVIAMFILPANVTAAQAQEWSPVRGRGCARAIRSRRCDARGATSVRVVVASRRRTRGQQRRRSSVADIQKLSGRRSRSPPPHGRGEVTSRLVTMSARRRSCRPSSPRQTQGQSGVHTLTKATRLARRPTLARSRVRRLSAQ
jgi:hypothetical protein